MDDLSIIHNKCLKFSNVRTLGNPTATVKLLFSWDHCHVSPDGRMKMIGSRDSRSR